MRQLIKKKVQEIQKRKAKKKQTNIFLPSDKIITLLFSPIIIFEINILKKLTFISFCTEIVGHYCLQIYKRLDVISLPVTINYGCT